MVLAALGVGVFAAYVQMTPAARRVPDELRRPKTQVSRPGPKVAVESTPAPRAPQEPAHGSLFSATVEGDEVKLVPITGDAKGETPIVFVTNQTLRNLGIQDAKAIGVHVHDRLASLDFNPSIYGGYGSTEEANLIKALQSALGQFAEVDSFELRVDGNKVSSLGHLELTEPIEVVRTKGAKADSEGVATKPSEDPASLASR
jgi:hypothetical protein